MGFVGVANGSEMNLLLGGASVGHSFTNTDSTKANYQGKSFGGGMNYYFGNFGGLDFAFGGRYESTDAENTANTDSRIEKTKTTVYALGLRMRYSSIIIGLDLEKHSIEQISSGSFDTRLEYDFSAPSYHLGIKLDLLGIPTLIMVKSLSTTIKASDTSLNNDTPFSQTSYWLMINLPLK